MVVPFDSSLLNLEIPGLFPTFSNTESGAACDGEPSAELIEAVNGGSRKVRLLKPGRAADRHRRHAGQRAISGQGPRIACGEWVISRSLLLILIVRGRGLLLALDRHRQPIDGAGDGEEAIDDVGGFPVTVSLIRANQGLLQRLGGRGHLGSFLYARGSATCRVLSFGVSPRQVPPSTSRLYNALDISRVRLYKHGVLGGTIGLDIGIFVFMLDSSQRTDSPGHRPSALGTS